MNEEVEIRELAKESLSCLYVINPKDDSFLERHQYHIPLETFTLFTYGTLKNSIRAIHEFRILSYHSKEGYQVQFFSNEENQWQEPFWVKDFNALRKQYFCYQDQTSLLRSTFAYDSVEKQFFRLYLLRYYITVPIKNSSLRHPYVSLEKKKVILKEKTKALVKFERSFFTPFPIPLP